MLYRHLGKSGLQVSAFSLGSWITFANQIDDATARDLMAYAYDQGVNFFDNAEAYEAGKSEEVMWKIFHDMDWVRSSYLVSSKVFFGAEQGKPNQTWLSRKHLVEACHQALKCLRVDYLDLYFCHRPDPETPIAEIVHTMNILLQQGKILYRWTSMWPADLIEHAQQFAIENNLIWPTMEQPRYHMFERERVEVEYDQLCDQWLWLTTFSPLAGGTLTGKYNQELPTWSRYTMSGAYMEKITSSQFDTSRLPVVKQLMEIAARIWCSVTQLSLLRCLNNPYVSTVILWATKRSQLEENIQSLEYLDRIDDEIIEEIDELLGG